MVCFGTFSLSAKEVGLQSPRTNDMLEPIDDFQLGNRAKRVAELIYPTMEIVVGLSMRSLCPEFF